MLKILTPASSVRCTGFSTLTRGSSLAGYTRSPGRIAEAAIGMLGAWARYQSAFSIRLVGVVMSGVEARPDPEELID